ncbi:hypothetical protein KBI33_04020 [Candidatus Shapirobacteria bacterium]|nr:hypothetical protein [Candidatus Shapirobacteria bacterium]
MSNIEKLIRFIRKPIPTPDESGASSIGCEGVEGWQRVTTFTRGGGGGIPRNYASLLERNDLPEEDGGTLKVLEGNPFLVLLRGHRKPTDEGTWDQWDNLLVIYSRGRYVATCRTTTGDGFQVRRSLDKDGAWVVRAETKEQGKNPPAKVEVRDKPDKDGWTVRQKGNFAQINDFELFKLYQDTIKVGKHDLFAVFKSPQMEFLVQRRVKKVPTNVAEYLAQSLVRIEEPGFLYKTDKSKGTAERVALTAEALEKRFGIKMKKGEYVSAIEDIVNENGTVRGVVIIKNRNGRSRRRRFTF